jgi:hypothetical protein
VLYYPKKQAVAPVKDKELAFELVTSVLSSKEGEKLRVPFGEA